MAQNFIEIRWLACEIKALFGGTRITLSNRDTLTLFKTSSTFIS